MLTIETLTEVYESERSAILEHYSASGSSVEGADDALQDIMERFLKKPELWTSLPGIDNLRYLLWTAVLNKLRDMEDKEEVRQRYKRQQLGIRED